MLDRVSEAHGIATGDMSYNDGAGPKNDKDAKLLADGLESILKDITDEQSLRLNKDMVLYIKDNIIYMDSMSISTAVEVATGQIVSKQTFVNDKTKIEEIKPLYSVSVAGVIKFIEFIKNSQGFKVC